MNSPTRSAECLSDLVLDEWLAGEIAPEAAARLERHVASCEHCRELRAARLRENAAFLAQAPSFATHARLVKAGPQPAPPENDAPRRKTRVFAIASAVLAAAAGVLLMLRSPAGPLPGERSKGRAHIGYFVKRGAVVTRGNASEPARPGDLLRFTYSNDRASHFALIDIDAQGTSVFFPSGETSAALAAGNDVALDFSIELDGTLGEERVIGVFCEQPFAVEAVRAALERERDATLEGCRLDALTLHKVAR
jgi:hypothetical protein